MPHHTKLDEKLKGADNFRAQKYRISLVLEENELDSYIHEEVPFPEGDEAKALHKKNMVMEKRIIADSIKDHLIPQVSSLKTPKAMFDALTKLFEGKNINRKMTLRNQLKNVKILLALQETTQQLWLSMLGNLIGSTPLGFVRS